MTNAQECLPDDSEGPCWVVLGGSESIRGIHMGERYVLAIIF